ncbi:hypothetical protein GC194_13705 [bacterium]|nr:hypothetical protein [bacterium]
MNILISILFSILWLGLPVWLILYYTKKTKGYYFYSRKMYEAFLECYEEAETFEIRDVWVKYKSKMRFREFRATLTFNKTGILIHSYYFRGVLLLYLNKEAIGSLQPPIEGLLHQIVLTGNTVQLYGEIHGKILNPYISFTVADLSKYQTELIQDFINNHFTEYARSRFTKS